MSTIDPRSGTAVLEDPAAVNGAHRMNFGAPADPGHPAVTSPGHLGARAVPPGLGHVAPEVLAAVMREAAEIAEWVILQAAADETRWADPDPTDDLVRYALRIIAERIAAQADGSFR